MPFARFAHLHAQIDDAGGKAFAAPVDHPRAFGRGLVPGKDSARVNRQAARRVGAGLGVDQADIGEMQGHVMAF